MKEIAKLKRTGKNDRDVVFRMVRIICAIWQTHPFREGNTRSIIVFAVLLAKHLRFEADHELFRVNSSYVRNALVWGAQGIYSKHEYLERIFFDAFLHENVQDTEQKAEEKNSQYEKIGDYKAKQQRSVTAADYAAQIKEYSQRMQELEAQQAELQTTENRYAEVKLWLDSFAEHIQSGAIMNADDSMIMKQLVEQIIVGDDGIEVHFKCGIVASHEYL